MKNKIMLTVAFGCAALTFTACGDEVTEQIVQSNSGLDTVAAIDELPECTSENAGAMAFVSDSAKVYYCADSSWQLLNGKDGVDGVDGVDGANGADGKDGADGESCNAIPLKDGTGFTIICGTDTVGTLLNGEKGDQGIQGEKGDKGDKGDTGEKGEDGKDGETGVVYYCGGLVYTPTTHFCKYDEIFALCDDGAVYDPKTEFCAVSGVVTTKCGGLTFDPTTDFCWDKKVYPLCSGREYDIHAYKCEDGKLYSLCSDYSETTQACYDGKIYGKCGDKLFDEALEMCENDEVISIVCGDKIFNPSIGEECREGVIFAPLRRSDD